ncbi:transcriptional regulator with XRE-family HTH domain [Alkalibacillus flavidus]|uniref:Transcriptional regulator with XRE-family HTH domain n=1 Tax=Alkalibacillus flavidus TaxID=546021 RepID=A0ABV2KVP8_9BACI
MDAEFIRFVRLKADLTQAEMASLSGVSQAVVSLVEQGKQPISPKLRHKILTLIDNDSELIEQYQLYKETELKARQ